MTKLIRLRLAAAAKYVLLAKSAVRDMRAEVKPESKDETDLAEVWSDLNDVERWLLDHAGDD